VRVAPLNSSSASDGQTIILEVPNNSIVDFNCSLFFTIATASTTATDLLALPDNIETLIERVQVVIGSNVAVDIPNYRILFNSMINSTCTLDKKQEREVLQRSQARAEHATAGNAGRSGTFVIKDWLGSICDQVGYIHSGLLPTVQLRITLASASVALGARGTTNDNTVAAGALSYSLSDITAIFEVVEMENPMYSQALLARANNPESPLQVNYRNYFSFLESRSASSGVFRVNVSSQSIDRLIVTQSLPNGGQENSTGATTNFNTVAGQVKGNRLCADGITHYNFIIDSKTVPNQTVGNDHTVFEQLQAVKSAYADDWSSGDMLCHIGSNTALSTDLQSIDAYRGASDNNASNWDATGRWQNCLSLADISGEEDRVMSGYSTVGGSTVIQYKYGGQAPSASRNLNMFVECTSSLLIGPNRAVQIVN
jgi:hypothetical protein